MTPGTTQLQVDDMWRAIGEQMGSAISIAGIVAVLALLDARLRDQMARLASATAERGASVLNDQLRSIGDVLLISAWNQLAAPSPLLFLAVVAMVLVCFLWRT